MLLLGEKRDGGLYTQEEIEIARAAGERLIDAQASAAMARRLMELQRQRLAESQVIDQRTRRVLHDDVLPQLHTALLMLQAGGAQPDAISLLSDTHRQIANLLHTLPPTATPELARLGLLNALRHAIENEFASAFDQVDWQIEPATAHLAERLSPLAAEVCFYAAREAVRNAARYGRPGTNTRPFQLTVAACWPNGLELTISDNGVGMGFAATSQGSGQGLALHSTLMAVIGGTLTASSAPGAGTHITLALPNAAETEPAQPLTNSFGGATFAA
ncbi:hypothetical protein SE17_30670 [Kouleothrix aurantiaca]|uniref:histidine kinase n=1 Tax=Kouleothrix aurantiaca TaxID=186479 RepID=A0A0P9FB18_9CHLR|nr:hypothetical protein SE17_30670 [Kouleothrix aurantiaca]